MNKRGFVLIGIIFVMILILSVMFISNKFKGGDELAVLPAKPIYNEGDVFHISSADAEQGRAGVLVEEIIWMNGEPYNHYVSWDCKCGPSYDPCKCPIEYWGINDKMFRNYGIDVPKVKYTNWHTPTISTELPSGYQDMSGFYSMRLAQTSGSPQYDYIVKYFEMRIYVVPDVVIDDKDDEIIDDEIIDDDLCLGIESDCGDVEDKNFFQKIMDWFKSLNIRWY